MVSSVIRRVKTILVTPRLQGQVVSPGRYFACALAMAVGLMHFVTVPGLFGQSLPAGLAALGLSLAEITCGVVFLLRPTSTLVIGSMAGCVVLMLAHTAFRRGSDAASADTLTVFGAATDVVLLLSLALLLLSARRALPIRNVYGASLRAAGLAAAMHRRDARPVLSLSPAMTRQVALVVLTAFAAAALTPLPTALLGRLPGAETQYDVPAASAQTSGCLFRSAGQPVTPAFCDMFDVPAGTGNRSGDLNGTLWGVSRTTADTNGSANVLDAWATTTLQSCGGPITVQPPRDVIICNGQVREASNDHQTITVLAMYPKQPFDFAGRTGTVAFDVTNDTHGNHAAWPEFWLTDAPVPAPFTHGADWLALPRNGFGLRFYSGVQAGQGGTFQNCPNDNHPRWTVTHGSVVVSRNWVLDDPDMGGSTGVTQLGCVIAPDGPDGGMNHIELRISQNQIDIYATDAGTTAPLILIGRVQNANLTLTRGLIWLEDVHYNASKALCCQTQHTFAWDNVGFDGPRLGRDLTFDVLDALVPAGDGRLNLGWRATDGNPVRLTTLPMTSTDIGQATRPSLLFNFTHYDTPLNLSYSINGHAHTAVWPYPDHRTYTWRAIELPIDLGDLVAGPNQVTISAGSALIVVANVDILLRPAAGAGDETQPSTATSVAQTPTSTSIPVSATATPTSIPGAPTATRTPTSAPAAATATRTPTRVPAAATATPTPTLRSTSTPISGTSSASSLNRIAWQGGNWYLHGVNVPWFNWSCDFGCGANGGVSSSSSRSSLDTAFAQLEEKGVHNVRWWVFPGNPWQITRDSSGAPTGLAASIYADFDAAIQLADTYDLYYDFVLFSAPSAIPGTWMTDATRRTQLATALEPLFARYSGNPRVLTWEVFNEPEWNIWNGQAAQASVQATVRSIADAVHRRSTAYVTVGSATLEGLPMWVGQGLDYYQAHWYDYMASGQSCLRCTDYATVNARYHLDRPLVVGEMYAGADTDALQRYADFYAKGFAGAWPWSLFPGHTSDHMGIDGSAQEVFASWYADIGPRAGTGTVPTSTPRPATSTTVPPSPTTRPTNTATPVPPTATRVPPTATPVPVASSGTIAVTFNDLPANPDDQPLNGIYPAGLINWGTGAWELSAPWGQMTTNHLELAGLNTRGSFNLVTPKRLTSLRVYNGGTASATVSLSCSGQPIKSVTLRAGTMATIEVGWTGPCTSVTITSSNGPLTHFDDLVFTS